MEGTAGCPAPDSQGARSYEMTAMASPEESNLVIFPTYESCTFERCFDPFDFAQGKIFAQHDKS